MSGKGWIILGVVGAMLLFSCACCGVGSVVWNADTASNQPQGASMVLIAWETRADANGNRLGVFMDGIAKALTPQEFAAAPKAKQR